MAEPKITEIEPGVFRYTIDEFYDAFWGDNEPYYPSEINRYTQLENLLPPRNGILRRRWGTDKFDDAVTPASMRGTVMGTYQNNAGTTNRIILCGGDSGTVKVKTVDTNGLLKNTGVYTLSGTTPPRFAVSRGFVYFANGTSADLKKYDGNDSSGSGTTTWGIAMPASSELAAAGSGSGSLTIRFWRDYCFAFRNTTTGHISDISDFTRLEPITAKAQIDLTSIDVDSDSSNTGTNERVVLATSDGGPRTRLYLLGTIADNTTTTLTDTVTPNSLLNQSVYVEVTADGRKFGVLDNLTPPNGKFPTKHRGRVYMAVNNTIVFSKSVEEMSTSTDFEIGGRYEEAFPAHYILDLPGTSIPTGIWSDGIDLIIGTGTSVLRLRGDGPQNFLPIETLFKDVGIVGDQAFTFVFMGGTQTGAVWNTPNKQIVFSDFNTYTDIGFPISGDVGNFTASNAFVRYGEERNVLGPSNNLIFFGNPAQTPKINVYSLDTGLWLQWIFATDDKIENVFYWQNPNLGLDDQVIISMRDSERLHKFNTAITTDLNLAGSTIIPAWTIESCLWDFGQPTTRKKLLQVLLTENLTDSETRFRVLGSDDGGKNLSTVFASAAPSTNPLGDTFCAMGAVKSDFEGFQWRFTSNSPASPSAEEVVLSRISFEFSNEMRQ